MSFLYQCWLFAQILRMLFILYSKIYFFFPEMQFKLFIVRQPLLHSNTHIHTNPHGKTESKKNSHKSA